MADALERIAGILDASGTEFGFAAIAVERGVEIGLNADALFPTASTFKVPVMVEVYAQARAGRFAIADRIPFEEKHRTIGSGVIQTLGAGIAPSIRDLMMLMIIISDNTATDILVDLVGAENVTARMRKLGLAGIHVPVPCVGLFRQAWSLGMDTPQTYASIKAASKKAPMPFASAAYARDASTNTATAADLARLQALIHTGEAGTPEDCKDMITIMETQHFQARVPRFLPSGSCANKTGSLRGLRNDCGLIRRGPGDTIAFALFTLDTTETPPGNSRQLVEADHRIGTAMGEVGQALWDDFAKP
jgi:beta-lactamase class A